VGHVANGWRREPRIGFGKKARGKEKRLPEYQDIGEWITLGWILKREVGVVWIGLVWLRIGTNGELL
jgi:hypothetical protein